MQTANRFDPLKKINQTEFAQEAERLLKQVKSDLTLLHGEPPCMYAIDIETLTTWSEAKREETLVNLRAVVSRAKDIMREAENEFARLCENADLPEADRVMPPVICFKSICEDLEAYEDVLHFVKSRE